MRISGITNCIGSGANGVYEPTAERCGGLPVYKKRGSGDVWLEYYAGRDQWQIKPTASKGKNSTWASVVCSPVQQLPQTCNGKSWMVLIGWNSYDLTGITIEEYTAAMAAADTAALETLIKQVRQSLEENVSVIVSDSIRALHCMYMLSYHIYTIFVPYICHTYTI